MKLYLVRHGESVYNVKNLHQHPQVTLSLLGKKQAEFVGKRFSSIPIDIILSSNHTRAKQTAKIINKTLQKKLVFVNLLGEIKRPSEFAGKSTTDPNLLQIKQTILKNMHNSSYHYADEENFYDLKKRAQHFLDFLTGRSEQNILAVTHGEFIKIILQTFALGDLFTPEVYMRFSKHIKIENTGITLCERNNQGKWILLTLNDYAHLGI